MERSDRDGNNDDDDFYVMILEATFLFMKFMKPEFSKEMKDNLLQKADNEKVFNKSVK